MAAARRLCRASWRFALPASSRLEANSTLVTSQLSVCQQFDLSPSPDSQPCPRSVEGSGFEDLREEGKKHVRCCLGPCCGPRSHLSRVVGWPEACSAIAKRNGRFVGARDYGNGRVCSDRFDDGGRLPWIAFQARGLATKAKKAKSKIEHSEPTEDTAATAKADAVKMMETALDVLSREHSKLRTGRASAGMLDHITVEAHGVRTPLNHIAAVTVSGLQTLNVLPYDASMVKEVEKAILNSPMGLNPQVNGSTMTVPLPRLTKEHCETMCKLVSKTGEAAKLTIRRSRKEALDTVKSTGDLSKDEMKRFEKEVEELTKKYTKAIDETCKNKEKEIMA